MKLYKVYVILGMIAAFGITIVSQVHAEGGFDPYQRIAELEQKLESREAIIMEQTRVIMSLVDQIPKQYEPFSLEKFPDTGGFNPAWLDGESEEITETCTAAMADGYEPGFCKYVEGLQ